MVGVRQSETEINGLAPYDYFTNSRTLLNENNEHNINLIVLPQVYDQGHTGLVKTKALLYSKTFFICMDKLVEQEISSCVAC